MPSVNKKPAKKTAVQFLIKGLAISLPPVLTIVILIWVGQAIHKYIIEPINTGVRYSIAFFTDESRSLSADYVNWDKLPALPYTDKRYRVTLEEKRKLQRFLKVNEDNEIIVDEIDMDAVYVPVGERLVPYRDYAIVARHVPLAQMPTTALWLYADLVAYKHFQGLFHLSAVALIITLILLYFLGRLMTARFGTWTVNKFETIILGRVPLVSNIYGSVKQVTDFVFTERTVEYNRVVAVEYPRRGVWTLGFVTGESMREIAIVAQEPLVTVLIPTSPMPMTGFIINLPRKDVIDLNLTIDQAFQFCLSCGVLVPPHQRVTPELLISELERINANPPQAAQHSDSNQANNSTANNSTADNSTADNSTRRQE